MKALETLKIIRGEADFNEDLDLMQDCEDSLKEVEELQSKIQELELIIKGKDVIIESMAHGKSCDGCAYWTLGGGCSGNFMIKCSRFPHSVDRYKQKENQDVK